MLEMLEIYQKVLKNIDFIYISALPLFIILPIKIS